VRHDSWLRRRQMSLITYTVFTLAASLMFDQTARAADDLVIIAVADAMNMPEYREELDGSVEFYFGSTAHPQILQTYGTFVTNKKTNAFAKAADVACRHVLLSALIALQDRAKSLGGNAVVNIKSYFKKKEASYDSQVECYEGFLMAGVALKGDVVKVVAE
jgi:uncharacterized protein YbjQ (UPF0145 family)